MAGAPRTVFARADRARLGSAERHRSNRVLESRNLLQRKGFPESYDRKALIRFLLELRSGAPEVLAPV